MLSPASRGLGAGAAHPEGKRLLGVEHSFFLAGSGGHASAGRAAGSSTDERALAAASQRPDQGARGSATADFLDIAFLMALALSADRTGVQSDALAVQTNRGQAHRQLAGCVQAAAGLGVGYHPGDGRSRPDHGLAPYDDAPREGTVEALAGARRSRSDLRSQANRQWRAGRNPGQGA